MRQIGMTEKEIKDRIQFWKDKKLSVLKQMGTYQEMIELETRRLKEIPIE